MGGPVGLRAVPMELWWTRGSARNRRSPPVARRTDARRCIGRGAAIGVLPAGRPALVSTAGRRESMPRKSRPGAAAATDPRGRSGSSGRTVPWPDQTKSVRPAARPPSRRGAKTKTTTSQSAKKLRDGRSKWRHSLLGTAVGRGSRLRRGAERVTRQPPCATAEILDAANPRQEMRRLHAGRPLFRRCPDGARRPCGARTLDQGVPRGSRTSLTEGSSGSACSSKPSRRQIASMFAFSRSTWPIISPTPRARA